jgi:regulatory protein
MAQENRNRGPRPKSESELWDYALRTLGGRALSRGELRNRLRRHAAPGVDIDEIVRKLEEYGYLSDQRFAEQYAARRLENQGLGRQRVLRDLRQRRVSGKTAEQAVESAYSEADEVGLIQRYLEKKYRRLNLAEHLRDPAHLTAVYRRLRYAGFSTGNVMRVLKGFSQEAELLEGTEGSEE